MIRYVSDDIIYSKGLNSQYIENGYELPASGKFVLKVCSFIKLDHRNLKHLRVKI
jgi:hypothetical protein